MSFNFFSPLFIRTSTYITILASCNLCIPFPTVSSCSRWRWKAVSCNLFLASIGLAMAIGIYAIFRSMTVTYALISTIRRGAGRVGVRMGLSHVVPDQTGRRVGVAGGNVSFEGASRPGGVYIYTVTATHRGSNEEEENLETWNVTLTLIRTQKPTCRLRRATTPSETGTRRVAETGTRPSRRYTGAVLPQRSAAAHRTHRMPTCMR
jgi:hypothetical protein